MSLRAEIVRLFLCVAVKRRMAKHASIDAVRKHIRRLEFFVPAPPTLVMTTTIDAGGVATDRIVPPNTAQSRTILFLHGGAYLIGSPRLYRDLTWRIAAAARATLLCPDYRLAPEHPFPAALDDAVAVWRSALAAGLDPAQAAIVGDSAGGGLTLATLLRLRDLKLPLPAAAVMMSPWTDLALTGASLARNEKSDPVIRAAAMPAAVKLYLGGNDPRDPYASPLYGDLSGLPPMLIQVGSDEVLLDDSVRIAERVRASGGDTVLELWPRMPHVWHLGAIIVPEAAAAIARIGAYLDARLRAD